MKPSTTYTEYALQSLLEEDGVYSLGRNKDLALEFLYDERQACLDIGIPEEQWPILLERTVETYAGSWRVLDD